MVVEARKRGVVGSTRKLALEWSEEGRKRLVRSWPVDLWVKKAIEGDGDQR